MNGEKISTINDTVAGAGNRSVLDMVSLVVTDSSIAVVNDVSSMLQDEMLRKFDGTGRLSTIDRIQSTKLVTRI